MEGHGGHRAPMPAEGAVQPGALRETRGEEESSPRKTGGNSPRNMGNFAIKMGISPKNGKKQLHHERNADLTRKMLGFRWGNGGNAGNGCLTLLNLGEMVG